MRPEIVQKTEKLTGKIFEVSANEIYLSMRYFHLAFHSLIPTPDWNTDTIGCDGFRIYYKPEYVMGLYESGTVFVNRVYLHMILHCMFKHVIKRGKREKKLWDLACDIVVESVLDSFTYRCVHLPVHGKRRNLYQKIKKEYQVFTAERVYEWLIRQNLSFEHYVEWAMEFRRDDHSFWDLPENQKENRIQNFQNKWQDISEKTQTEMETFAKDQEDEAGDMVRKLQVENRKKYDYKSFLRQFAILREEMQVDIDSFDYGFYTYGLNMYGNMPLIEPQEWKEVKKIQEFVIAIDTSMSCSEELVQIFLEQTYAILKETESFFQKVKIHLIQCDSKVQSDVIISCEDDLKRYMDELTIRGGGGTDFRPVFQYVDELIEQKYFYHLKGLVYFTDGYGEFPKVRPLYDTAFVFLQQDYNDVNVPPWAMKLILQPEDMKDEY
ncbi:MAG: VWA-like domain-containing protein [Lachnospiraceae bacterium]|nr:VWA-like domain-containing protein [Lachnospiraceae bacterium]